MKEAWRTAIKGREAAAYLRGLLAKAEANQRSPGTRSLAGARS